MGDQSGPDVGIAVLNLATSNLNGSVGFCRGSAGMTGVMEEMAAALQAGMFAMLHPPVRARRLGDTLLWKTVFLRS